MSVHSRFRPARLWLAGFLFAPALFLAAPSLVDAATTVPTSLPSIHPGDLDTTFGADGSGQITFNFGGNWDAGTHIIVQPDGRYLVAGHGVGYVSVADRTSINLQMRAIGFLARYLPDGSPDTSFNGTGQRVFGYDDAGMYLNDVLLQPDGKVVVVAWRCCEGYKDGVVMRLNADGSTDATFGNGGQLVVSASAAGLELSLGAIAMLPDGRLLVAGSEGPSDGWGGTVPARPFTLRLFASGQPDASYGPAGRVSHASLADDLVPRRIALQTSGMATVVGSNDYGFAPAMAIRLNSDGTPDTTFANAGKYVAAVADLAKSEPLDLLLEADGSLVMVGTYNRGSAYYAAFAIRLTPSGQPDATFGKAGIAIWPGLLSAHGVTQQPDGKLLISGSSRSEYGPNSEALVARLTPTGELDPSFGTAGVTTQSFGAETNATALDADGKIVLVGGVLRATGDPQRPSDLDFMLARLVGDEVPPGALIEAVEYYHQQFEHYFVTADPAEIDALDSNAIPGWWRTGQRYRVQGAAGADRAPVCRFYTGAFAGKASHFYTASAAECEYVKRLPEWIFEGVAFYSPVPGASGSCANEHAPVYRLYNDGHGGAPNHAYTPDTARRDRLLQAHWVSEGTAWCVPVATQDPAARTMLLAQVTWNLPIGYPSGWIRTTFAGQLSAPASARWKYAQFDLSDPPATIYHQADDAWTGYAHFEPLTGRFLVVGNSGFEESPYVGDVWEFESATRPATPACHFGVRQNLDSRYPSPVHPFQPVLWSGCMLGVANTQ